MRAIQLIMLHVRLAALTELQYRANFVAQLASSAATALLAIVSTQLVFAHTTEVGGWSRPELYVVVGCWFIVSAIVETIALPPLRTFASRIQQGDFDYILVRPEDAQTLMSVQTIEPWPLVNVAVGIGFITYGVRHAPGMHVTAAGIAVAAIMLLCGALMLYSVMLLASTLCFWFVRMGDLLFSLSDTFDAGRWPLGVFPPWLKIVLVSIVPVGLAVTVPAASITGRLHAPQLAFALAMTVVLFSAARMFFRFGIRHYSGASS